MFNIKKLLRSALMAIVLAGTAGVALATPYHVTINTAAFGTGSGILDFLIYNDLNAPSASATISNFSGNIGGVYDSTGSISGSLPGTTTFSNALGLSELAQIVTFGSVFSFDIDFSGAFKTLAGNGTTFGIAFYTDGFGSPIGVDPLGTNANLVEFALSAMSVAGAPGTVTSTGFGFGSAATAATVTAIAAVPEPADWLLMLTGLAFVVYMTRLNGRTNARRLAVA